MPDPEQTPGPQTRDLVRRLARPAVALAGVIVFQLLFAAVLHHPVLHQAPVAGRSPLAQVVSGHGGGTVRLVAEPTAGSARAALTGRPVNAALIAGPKGDSLLIQTAAGPGTAGVLTRESATAAAALRTLLVRDLVPLPAPGSAGASLFFLVIAWMLGGYVAVTALGGMRGPGLRQAAIWLGLLASPWNVIGQGLPPSAVLSAGRGVVYLGGANLTGPLAVLTTYAAAGTLLTLAATAWRRHRLASRTPQLAAQAAGTAAASLAA